MREPFAALLRTGAGKLALSLLLLASPTPSTAYSFKSVQSPNLNLDDLGRIAFTGDFDAISLYQYEGQSQQYPGRNGALLSRYPNGVFATINVTDADIKAMCSLQVDGTERIIFAGNFTGVGTLRTPGGVALLNPSNGTIQPMVGLTGSVNTLYCDRAAGQVYVGGQLTGSNSSNAIIWKSNGWQDLSFEGFNGAVHSITKAANGNIIFGGAFNGLGGNVSMTTENSTQVIPLSSGSISAQTSSGLPGFTDPTKIACKTDFTTQGTDSTWLLADKSPGFWKDDFGFGFEPTALKMYNTNYQGRGTKTFRFTALPLNGIMNLSYVDPSSGQKAYCDAACPLPEGNTTVQTFNFVNVVGMNSFKVDLLDWYGAGAGLNGIQVTQDSIFSYAINDFNEPKNCSAASSSVSQATTTGSWQVTQSHSSSSEYLTTTVTGNPIDPQAAAVTFIPDIRQSGNYSVIIYTPGCQDDGTCGSRGRVDITANVGSQSQVTTLWQTNTYEKYDEVYNGFIDASSRPQIIVRASPNQGPSPLTLVAERVRFNLLKATSGNLNGIFEYTPGKLVNSTDFKDSVINAAGASLLPKEKATITSLSADSQRLYVGGNFSADDGRNNIFYVPKDGTSPTALPGHGLNNQVMTLYQNDSMLYVGGNFTNTVDNNVQGLNGVAALVNDQWKPLGAGVDGVVLYLVPFSVNITANKPEQVLAVSGFFSLVNAFGNNTATRVSDFAIWVPSHSNWLHNLEFFTLAMSGRLMTYADVPGSDRWYGGSVSSGALLASGTAELSGNNANLALHAFPIGIEAQQLQVVTSKKRAIVAGEDMKTTGVHAGTFYKQNGMNKTILAGHFATVGTDKQNITNVAIIDGNDSDRVTGFDDQMDPNSTYAAVAVQNNILYAGGMITGKPNNSPVAGIVAYDLANKKYATVQLPALQGDNVTVNTIVPQPKSNNIYVGGVFKSAGSLACPALCIWNTDRNQWTSPSDNLAGDVTSLIWISDTKVLIAGNLTSGDNTTTIMSYDTISNQFAVMTGANALPGPVTALTLATSDGKQVWAAGTGNNGSVYLQRFDGSKWTSVNETMFDKDTVIRGIQSVRLSQNHANSKIIDQNTDLLLMGQINIVGFGSASAALFNGVTLTPFLLATKGQDGATASGSLSSIFVENPNFFFNGSSKPLMHTRVFLFTSN